MTFEYHEVMPSPDGTSGFSAPNVDTEIGVAMAFMQAASAGRMRSRTLDVGQHDLTPPDSPHKYEVIVHDDDRATVRVMRLGGLA
jgi:hypothetical protein